jgi:hypothetical protein
VAVSKSEAGGISWRKRKENEMAAAKKIIMAKAHRQRSENERLKMAANQWRAAA